MSVVDYWHEPFQALVSPTARIEKIYDGMLWAEGPVWFADMNCLIWSDIPNNRLLRWIEGLGTHTYRQPSNFANGNTRDRSGRLVTCEHGLRRVTRTEVDGTITVLADAYRGRRLNSPNDVVVSSDNAVWFTDPVYGILSYYEGEPAEQEQEGQYVYRIDAASGEIKAMVCDCAQPNGLAFSPDESVLYVVDSGGSTAPGGAHHIRAFTVDRNGELHGGEVFAEIEPGVPDGLRVDVHGNLWVSAADGVHCFSANGVLLGKIRVPEVVSNLAFGGTRKNELFITATSGLYHVKLGTKGI